MTVLIQDHKRYDFDGINFARLVEFHKEGLKKMLSGESATSLFSYVERRKLSKENIIVCKSNRYSNLSFVTEEAKEVLKKRSWLKPFSLEVSPPEPLRRCRVCGIEVWTERGLDQFVKDKDSLHGVQPVCKQCSNLRGRLRKAALWRS